MHSVPGNRAARRYPSRGAVVLESKRGNAEGDTDMSVRIMSMAFASKINPISKLVLLAISDFGNDDGKSIYPSVRTLCDKTSLSESAIRKTIKALRSGNIIRPVRIIANRPTTYEINVQALEELKRPVCQTGQGVPETGQGVPQTPPIYNHQLTVTESRLLEAREEVKDGFDVERYVAIWADKFGGEFPRYRFIKGLKALEARVGAEMALGSFARYVASTEPRWASVSTFLAKPAIYVVAETKNEYTGKVKL